MNDLFQAGRLREATAHQLEAVKTDPGDPGKRLHLAELSLFGGDFERAKRQLVAVNYGTPEQDLMVAEYRQVLDTEPMRANWLANGVRPHLVGGGTPHLLKRLDGCDALRGGDTAKAAELFAEADALTPTVEGTLNDTPFKSLRDSDDRFGGVLEIVVGSRWSWVAFEHIATITANPPKYPRDMYWVPVRIQLRTGQTGEAYLPALYPGTFKSADEAVQLGRETDWQEPGDNLLIGLGRRIFQADDRFVSVLELRELVVEGAAIEEPEAEVE